MGMPIWLTQEMVPSDEFAEWAIRERIEPWSARRLDLLFGLQTTTLVNWLRIGRGRKMKVSDATPDWDKAPRETPAQLANKIRQWGHWFKELLTTKGGQEPSPK